MNELSLYILDLVQNSVSAGARHVVIEIRILPEQDRIEITIRDDGCGMDEALLARVSSPFATTRKTRKVGLGIPMIRELCESCGGTFRIESTVGVGTALYLTMQASHIDLPPMGNLPDTMVSLVNGSPETPEFTLRYQNADEFVFDTAEIRQALGGVSLNSPEVLSWMREYLIEGITAAGKLP